MLQPLFADYVNFIHYLNEIVVFYKKHGSDDTMKARKTSEK